MANETTPANVAIETLVEELKRLGADLGVELAKSASAIRQYASERAASLAEKVGRRGFNQAVQAEADSIALFAVGRAIDSADAADSRILGTVGAVIRTAAKFIATA